MLQKHVNDLLDIARMEAARMSLLYSKADLASLVRLMAANFEAGGSGPAPAVDGRDADVAARGIDTRRSSARDHEPAFKRT